MERPNWNWNNSSVPGSSGGAGSIKSLLWLLLLAAFFKSLPPKLSISLAGVCFLIAVVAGISLWSDKPVAALAWPKLTSLKEAEQAAHRGAWGCFLIAAFTAVVAGISLWSDKPVLGIDAEAFVGVLICLIAGWRIWRLSRIWAVLILVIVIIDKLRMIALVLIPSSAAGFAGAIFMSVVITVVLIGSVRGTFAYHAIKKKESVASFGMTAGGNQ